MQRTGSSTQDKIGNRISTITNIRGIITSNLENRRGSQTKTLVFSKQTDFNQIELRMVDRFATSAVSPDISPDSAKAETKNTREQSMPYTL